MNIEKGIYWDEMCNPVVTDRCACEVKDCWAKAMMRNPRYKGVNPSPDENGVGWYPDRLNKIKVTGPAKVYAMCWLGDIGWSNNSYRNKIDYIFYRLWSLGAIRYDKGLCGNHFLFLTKWPEQLINIGNVTPIENIWIGTSISSCNYTYRANPFVDSVRSNHWLSLEPLTGQITIPKAILPKISQVIVGGDSRSRENTDLDAVRSIVEQCQAASIPVFVKQLTIDHKCTADMTDWPADLRVRELIWRKE